MRQRVELRVFLQPVQIGVLAALGFLRLGVFGAQPASREGDLTTGISVDRWPAENSVSQTGVKTAGSSIPQNNDSAETITLSGLVRSSATGQGLYALIVAYESATNLIVGTTHSTNGGSAQGAYTLELPAGNYDFYVRSFGYRPVSVSGVSVQSHQTLDFPIDTTAPRTLAPLTKTRFESMAVFTGGLDTTRVTINADSDLGPKFEVFNEFGNFSVDGLRTGTISVFDDGTHGDAVARDRVYSRSGIGCTIRGQFRAGTLNIGLLLYARISPLGEGIFQIPSAALNLVEPEARVDVARIESDFQCGVFAANLFRTLPDSGPNRDSLKQITASLYQRLADNYDFVIYFPEEGLTGAAGMSFAVKNLVEGIGLGQFDYTVDFGSVGKLQQVVVISPDEDPPLLHETMHRWGVFLNDLFDPTHRWGAHWGYSGAHGVLGGFDPAGLVNNGDGTYLVGPELATIGYKSDVKFGAYELYLAGLLAPVQLSSIPVLMNAQPVNGNPFLVTADALRNVTVQDIIAQYGQRVPGVTASQKAFRAAFVGLSEEPLNDAGMAYLSILARTYGGLGPAESIAPWPSLEKSFLWATNGLGSMDTSIETLTPAIVTAPRDFNTIAGVPASFAVSAIGAVPLTFQWQRSTDSGATWSDVIDGGGVSGATAMSLSIASTTTTMSAQRFRVTASNSTGSVTSSAATLTISTAGVAPTVVSQPENQTVVVGKSAAFSVSASGTPSTFTYRWQRAPAGTMAWVDLPLRGGSYNGTAKAGLTVAATSTAQSGDQFRCWVSNGVFVVSAPATLTVLAPSAPTITAQPLSTTVTAPVTATFSISASGTPAAFTYAWQRKVAGTSTWSDILGGGVYTGATTASLTVGPTTTAMTGDELRCRVSNGVSPDAVSNVATLTIEPVPGAPTISLQPIGVSISAGGSVTLSVETTAEALHALARLAAATFAYQWRLNGVDIGGATSSTYTIPSVQVFHAGIYSVVVSVGALSSESNGAVVAVPSPAESNARLLNLSTRALALTGDNVLIPGFVVAGPGNKQLLIRAVGPTLAGFGVTGTLPDPRLTLKRWNGTAYEDIANNDNWGTNPNAAAIIAKSADLFAFPLTAGSADAALLVDLPPGQYSAVAGDAGTGTGIAIVELYDADVVGGTARLINISNRGFVGTGDSIMIPGYVVSSEGPKTLLIRAVGPTLSAFGVSGVLADPTLAIYRRNQTTNTDELILTNNDWSVGPGAAHTRDVAAQLLAFALPEGSKDAAFVVTLNPGIYTVHARGANDTTGVALVEVYVVP